MLFSIVAMLALSLPAAAQDAAAAASAATTPAPTILAQVQIATSPVMPTYLSLTPNINEFLRFADGGPDYNWYVGYNNAWIVKLPPAPEGDFSHAYIGARVGRAKTKPDANKPWLRQRIDGRLYMAISQQPAFSAEQSFFLADAVDIPLEPDPQTFVEGVGPGEWFWAEVPLNLVSFNKPNYVIIYSPSRSFESAATAPILAGAEIAEAPAGGGAQAWNNHSIVGVPPRSAAGALETPLTNMSPALAIKLVPNADSEVSVGDFTMTPAGRRTVFQFSVAATDAAEAWLETSRDQLDWARATHYRRQQPYIISLNADKLTPGTFIRAAARDSLGKVGYSDAIAIPYPQQ